jgi:hypothetical protein
MENSNQSAFPVTKEILDLAGSGTNPFGLTKREYFAGLAMQSVITSFNGDPAHFVEMSKRAVMAADALLNALNPKSEMLQLKEALQTMESLCAKFGIAESEDFSELIKQLDLLIMA